MNPEPLDNISTKLIATIIPAIVAECGKRFFNFQNDDLTGIVNTVSDELLSECSVLDENTEREDLTIIQNLKLDLDDILEDFKEEICDDLRTTLKVELKTELYMFIDSRIEKLKSESCITAASVAAKVPGAMGKFALKASPAKTVLTKSALAGQSSENFKIRRSSEETLTKVKTEGFAPSTLTQSNPTQSSTLHQSTLSQSQNIGKVTNDIPESLANNPLFAQVSKNVSRAAKGESMYTADEFIEARGTRFDESAAQDIRNRYNGSRYAYDEDEEEDKAEQDRWDKLLLNQLESTI